jgi:hypothetical protein
MGQRSSLQVLSLVALVFFAVLATSFASEKIYPIAILGGSRNLVSTPTLDITNITDFSTIVAGRSVTLNVNSFISRALFLGSTLSVDVPV